MQLTETTLMVLATVFLAAFTQSLTGFGSALIAMPLLSEMLGIRIAAPLVALLALTLEVGLLVRYRRALSLHVVRRIVIASVLGTPLGVLALRHVSERITLPILGAIVLGYAVYALLDLQLPELRHPAWAYGLGFVSGVLGGAYNTSGPPVIIYGDSQGWEQESFKGNLQGFFLANSLMVVAGHLLSRNLTTVVWQNYLTALLAAIPAAVAGLIVNRWLSPQTFRRVVLLLLLVLGFRLII